MPNLTDTPPNYVTNLVTQLDAALNQSVCNGGVPAKAGNDLLIATWNIREFGRYTEKWTATGSDSPKRDLRSLLLIAKVLERFDIIAVQEVQGHVSALREVIRYLNSQEGRERWVSVVSDSSRKSNDNPDERLGYVLDTDRVVLAGLVGEVVLPPSYFETISPDRLIRQFARTPYAVGFRPLIGSGHEFVLVTLHFAWKDTTLREFEMRKLAEWIAMWSQESQAWSADIFALGDFNQDRYEDPDNAPFNQLLTMPSKMHAFPRTIFTSGQNKHYDMVTWIGGDPTGPSSNLVYQECGYFDHETTLRSAYGGTLSKNSYSFRVSDHYPLWAQFRCA